MYIILGARYNKSDLETEKDNFKTAKTFLLSMLHRKKKLLFWKKTSSKLKKT